MARHHLPVGRRAAALALVAIVVAGCGSGGSQSVAQATGTPAASDIATDLPSTSAADLIQADVDAGKIDANTGLLYRLEAQFGAPGLPAQYKSAPVTEDIAVFDMAAHALAKMPADIQSQVAPYLARPTNAISVFHGKGKAFSAPKNPAALADVARPPKGAAAAPGDVVCGGDGWASVSSAAIPVTIWGECGGNGRDDSDLTRALAAIESTYPDEVSIMGDPVPDTGDEDAGASPNLDIYLVDSCVTRDGTCNDIRGSAAGVTIPTSPFQGPDGANTSSGFILIYRGYAASAVDIKDIETHEMFHVLENAHNEEGRLEGGKSHWMTEASAKWAEEVFVPEARAEWVYPWFGAYQATDLGLTTKDGRNEYESFVWPYFMDQESGPSSIGKAWKAFEGLQGWQAFNASLTGILSFKERFKDFALRAWNTDMPGGGTPDLITPKFQAVDGQFPKTAPNKPVKFYFRHPNAVKVTDPAIKVPETMPALSERYAELELGDDTQQLIADFSGLQPNGPLDVTALVHIKGGQWKKEPLPTGKTTWCRAQEDVDRVLFVLDNNSYSANSPIAGTWQYQAVTDACNPGAFNVTVANGKFGKHAGAGTYSGQAPIDCFVTNGTEWHGAFVDKNGINGIQGITLDMGSHAYVDVSTVYHNEDVDEFHVEDGFENGTVSVSVDDQGKIVKLTVHAVDLFSKVDGTITCGSILR
jgi:hypothetical protein